MMMRWLLPLYRIAILIAVAWILREHAIRVRFEGFRPITVTEVREVLPAAAALAPDTGERAGADVLDTAGAKIGYVLQTALGQIHSWFSTQRCASSAFESGSVRTRRIMLLT